MKKNLWKLLLGLNVLLVILTLIYGWHLYQEKMEDEARQERLAQLATAESQLSESQGSVQQQVGAIDHTFVSVAYPLDTQSVVIPLIKEKMDAYIAEKVGTSQGVENTTDAVYMDAVASETSFEGVTHYHLEARCYKDNGKVFESTGSETIQDFDLKVDGQVFSLSDFIQNQDDFKVLLNEVVDTALVNNGEEPEDRLDKETRLIETDINTLAYSYSDSQFTVNLPETIGSVTSVSLPIASMFEVINGAYLKTQDLADYQSFVAEKERLSSGNRVALTFDDGPNPATTTQILDILAKYKVKATFYVIGSKVAGNEAILKRMVAEGHEIGNHTWSHPVLTQLSQAAIQNEIASTNQAIQAATGKTPKTIRPPYGATNATVAATVGMPEVLWTVDTRDWESHNPTQILANVKTYTRPNGVVLMHDIHQETANSVESIIQYLQGQGYAFETVSELYGY